MNRRSFLSLAAAASIPPMAVAAVTAKPDPKDAINFHFDGLIEALGDAHPGKSFNGQIDHENGFVFIRGWETARKQSHVIQDPIGGSITIIDI